ncbi:MAG: tetratricopeptide repeat protein [Phaeospirillum sp.]|nr:tetratricopeptide repeat protein [Phaeospirillum sp.]
MPPATIDEILARHRAGRLQDAERMYLDLLAVQPDHAVALHLLGVVAYQTGRLELAVERIGRAVAVNPDFAEAYSNLGNALKQLGRVDEAMQAYRRAIALKPAFPEPWFNLGSVLHELGRRDEAIDAYGKALEARPDYVDALSNLGLALKERDRPAEAADSLRRAIALRPDHAEALSNLGLILKEGGRVAEAVALFRQAVASRPDHARFHANLGLALEEAGEIEAAEAALRRALTLDPAFSEPLPNLVHLRRKLCRWDDFAADDARLVELARRQTVRIPPFITLATAATAADQLTGARHWATGLQPPPGGCRPHRPPAPGGRIHVGYLSVDLRNHPVAHLAAELFERHDRDRFRITAYSCGVDDGSAMRRRLEAGFDSFVDLCPLDDAEAVRRIEDDDVHILVDLTGYTTGARTAILAARPAPVQVNYLGFPGTMGADFMDYIIGDRIVTPPEQQPNFAERLVRLPHSYQANDTRRPIAPRRPSRAECGLPERGFVFCCFNNTFKITPAVFDVWMRLLAEASGSVLWLLRANDTVGERLKAEAARRGIAPDRLIFAERCDMPDHLARHDCADLFLDTLPYNAHTTASDALWAGLPVLTCLGETFAGRVAASLLSAVGLPELITSSPEEYEALALTLARDPLRLEGLRRRLQHERDTAPLFDSAGFTRDLEAAYTRMWERWRAGQPPEAFAIG